MMRSLHVQNQETLMKMVSAAFVTTLAKTTHSNKMEHMTSSLLYDLHISCLAWPSTSLLDCKLSCWTKPYQQWLYRRQLRSFGRHRHCALFQLFTDTLLTENWKTDAASVWRWWETMYVQWHHPCHHIGNRHIHFQRNMLFHHIWQAVRLWTASTTGHSL